MQSSHLCMCETVQCVLFLYSVIRSTRTGVDCLFYTFRQGDNTYALCRILDLLLFLFFGFFPPPVIVRVHLFVISF